MEVLVVHLDYDPLGGLRATEQDIRITVDTSGSGDKLSQAIAESIQIATRSGYSTDTCWVLMTVPVVNAIINFSTGPSFAQTLILDEGKLDVNILGDATAVIVDVSNQINRIEN
jgi:hypothetical protein